MWPIPARWKTTSGRRSLSIRVIWSRSDTSATFTGQRASRARRDGEESTWSTPQGRASMSSRAATRLEPTKPAWPVMRTRLPRQNGERSLGSDKAFSLPSCTLPVIACQPDWLKDPLVQEELSEGDRRRPCERHPAVPEDQQDRQGRHITLGDPADRVAPPHRVEPGIGDPAGGLADGAEDLSEDHHPLLRLPTGTPRSLARRSRQPSRRRTAANQTRSHHLGSARYTWKPFVRAFGFHSARQNGRRSARRPASRCARWPRRPPSTKTTARSSRQAHSSSRIWGPSSTTNGKLM